MRHLLAQCQPLEGGVEFSRRSTPYYVCVKLIHDFRVTASIGHYYCPIEEKRNDKVKKVEMGEIDKDNVNTKSYAGFSNRSIFKNKTRSHKIPPKLKEIHLNFTTQFPHLTLLKYPNQITV